MSPFCRGISLVHESKESASEAPYGVAQNADAFDLDFDHVAVAERTDARGRARRDEVTRLKRHHLRDVANEEGDGEGQRARAPVLSDFAVDARLDGEV